METLGFQGAFVTLLGCNRATSFSRSIHALILVPIQVKVLVNMARSITTGKPRYSTVFYQFL